MFLAFGTKESALAWAPFLCCHLLAKAWLAGEPLTLGQLTNGKPSTLKLQLKKLIHHGHLLPKGQGRGAHYIRQDAS